MRASRNQAEAVIVIAILDAISNSVSATSVSVQPAAGLVGQAGASQRAPGGFASTLAAAQGLGSTSPSAVAEVQASGGLAGVTARPATNLNVRTPAAENSPLRKLMGSFPATLNMTAVVNLVVPLIVPATARPLQAPPLQASLAQPSLGQTSLPPAPTMVAQAQVPDLAVGTVQPELQSTAYNTAAPPVSDNHSMKSTAGILDWATAASMPIPLTDGSTSADPIANISGQTNSQETTTVNSAPSSLSTAKTTASSTYVSVTELGSQSKGPQNSLWLAGPLLAVSAPPTVHSTATNPPMPIDLSTEGNASAASGLGPVSDGPVLGKDQAVDPTAFASTLLANARTGVDPGGVLPGSADIQSGQAGAANVIATDNANPIPSDLGAQTGTENPLFAAMSGQLAGGAIPSPLVPLAPGTALRFAVPSVAEAVTTPNIRRASLGEGAPAPTLASVLPTAPDSVKALPVASQTPFSVFFSGQGPSTESAASVLPRMILPATSSAVRDGHTSLTQAPGTIPPTNGFESGGTHTAVAQNSLAQNVVAQNAKDTSAGAGSGAGPVGQPFRRDGDLSAAAQPAVAQTAAASVAPPPASAGVIVPLAWPAALVGDSLPKTDTLAGSAPGGAANVVALPAENSAVALPGPVQMAQMVNRVEQSEMRIGMTTAAFGSVEVRTVVHANDVGLVIGSEKGDLRALLSSELPAIANTLQEQNLRLHSVNFMQGFAFSNHASGGGDPQQRSFVPMRPASSAGLSEATGSDPTEVLPAGEFSGEGSGLSILA
jgi:hypothetical protein